ncbi:IS110 family transposase, partial [Vibrio campbellii]
YVKERTACMSRIGTVLLEFGLSFPRGHAKMKALFQWLAEQDVELPQSLIAELLSIHEHYKYLNDRVSEQDQKLKSIATSNESAELLKTIPGVGDLTAT